jgi:hypothetical protein
MILISTKKLILRKPFLQFKTCIILYLTARATALSKQSVKTKLKSVTTMALSRAKGESLILTIVLLAVCLVVRGGHARQLGRPSTSIDHRGSAPLFASHIIKAPKIAQGGLLCPEGYKVIHGKCKKVFPSLVRNQVSALELQI